MTNLYPVRDIFVHANGIRHHLLARGAPGAPVVMMIHGLAGQAHTFDGIANFLAARFHVYCLDVRGRGESEWGPPEQYTIDTYVQDLEAVREALGLQRFALVGTSMGGLITMQYAPRYPERISHAVLNDIGPEIDPAGLQRILAYLQGAPEMFADLKAVARYYRQHYAPMVANLNDDQLLEFARYNVRRSDAGVYVWKMDPAIRTAQPAPPSIDPWEAYRAISCPVLIVRGAQSDVLSPETARKMLEANPRASLVEVPGVGHAPLLTEPEARKALEAFLARSDGH
ncbi:alpha/beta hydrolase [Tepidiforma sp.]|uniref:alpha/beta fold hydrolase n=1 Tax=Tepidiforma sp. TaxID=2682230 RepID=UPI002ADE8831|nr:alpha/beta hydrolase [Tepidiforma sp.]